MVIVMEDVIRIRLTQLLLFVGIGFAISADTGNAQESVPAQASNAETPLQVALQPPKLGWVTDTPSDSVPKSSVGSKTQLVAAEVPITNATSEAALEVKHDSVTSELRVAMLQEQSADQKTVASETKPSAESNNVDLLKQIDVTIAQQKSATKRLQDIEAKKAELEVELAKLADKRLEQDPPYSILLLDKLRDSISSGKAKQESLEASMLSARDAVEKTKSIVDEKKIVLRQLKERTPDEDPKLRSVELDVRLAEETLVLRKQELLGDQASEAIRSLQTQIDETKLEIVRTNVQFSKETLDEQLAEVNLRESSLKRRVSAIKSEINYAENRWMAARQEADATLTPTPVMVAKVDALNTAKQTSQLEETVINQRLARIPQIATSWKRRHRVVMGDYTREERNLWLADTEDELALLKRERRSRELKLDEIRVSIGSIDSQIDLVNGSDPELKRWLMAKRQAVAKQIEIYNDSILATESAARVASRLQVQISGGESRSLTDWAADTWAAMKRIWNHELADVNETSLTVGKILSSILLLFLGYFAASWLSRLLGRKLPKFGVDEAATHAIQSLSFYVLLITFTLAALKYASVPLTVFTFLGGAIAIGVGFGSQNILNNFISGLILLAERPIKVGDLILIDSIHGNVTQIGARSTQIRTGDNQDIIVPNSTFLESNVVNLTRRDDRLRTSISVGVAYGSPLERVVELLRDSATEHPKVHAKPKPMVWFTDFGDNSLMFQVHFWINARSVTQMRQAETEVRLSIDRLFRENGIVIAFPQRDLHIQSTKPLEFRIVGGEEGDQGTFSKAG